MKAWIKTVVQLLKKHCLCGTEDCSTYKHDPNCEGFQNADGSCAQCSHCICQNCESCNVRKLSGTHLADFMKLLNCNDRTIGSIQYPKIECLINPKKCSCTKCKLPNLNSLLQKLCPSFDLSNIDANAEVKTKKWATEFVPTETGVFKIHVLKSQTVNALEFLNEFYKDLTKKFGFVWHFHCEHLQRNNYNTMIEKFQNGTFGDNVMMLTLDYAFDWTIKNSRKLSAKEFFGKKKCQILSIVEYSNFFGKYTGISNFILSDQNINKKALNSIADLKKRIVNAQKKNPSLQVIHLFSDGAWNEFLNCNIFGNLGALARELQVTIVWNYFCAHHGKQICDSEIARLKVILDRKFIDTDEQEYPRFAHGIHKFCVNELNTWQCKGKQITGRKYFLKTENCDEYDKIFRTAKDTSWFRCCMWDRDGTFYRKYHSCTCDTCVTNPLFASDCAMKSLTGTWKTYQMKRKP